MKLKLWKKVDSYVELLNYVVVCWLLSCCNVEPTLWLISSGPTSPSSAKNCAAVGTTFDMLTPSLSQLQQRRITQIFVMSLRGSRSSQTTTTTIISLQLAIRLPKHSIKPVQCGRCRLEQMNASLFTVVSVLFWVALPPSEEGEGPYEIRASISHFHSFVSSSPVTDLRWRLKVNPLIEAAFVVVSPNGQWHKWQINTRMESISWMDPADPYRNSMHTF